MKKVQLMMVMLFALVMTSVGYSQDRVNATLPKISNQDLGSLQKATGWLLNVEGQWVSSDNKLPKYSEYTHKVSTYKGDGLGYDNFSKYEFRELVINSDTLMIFIKGFTDGYYKYSSIKKGWSTHKEYNYYVFKKSELSKFDSITDSEINLIEIDLQYKGNIFLSYNGNYISDIEKEIATKKDGTDSKLIFHVAPYKEKSLVQFQIYVKDSYSEYSKSYYIGGIQSELKAKTPESKYSWDGKQIYMTDELFKHLYYEVDYVTFTKFIKLP